MSEHARANGYQWTDAEVYMVWDMFHDSPERVGNRIFSSKQEAIDYAVMKGWEERTVILKVPAIVASQTHFDIRAAG